jgi:hypothetical protein
VQPYELARVEELLLVWSSITDRSKPHRRLDNGHRRVLGNRRARAVVNLMATKEENRFEQMNALQRLSNSELRDHAICQFDKLQEGVELLDEAARLMSGLAGILDQVKAWVDESCEKQVFQPHKLYKILEAYDDGT